MYIYICIVLYYLYVYIWKLKRKIEVVMVVFLLCRFLWLKLGLEYGSNSYLLCYLDLFL